VTEPKVVHPSAILSNAKALVDTTRLADTLSRQIDPGGTPDAKIRLGYVTSFDPSTWTVTATIGDPLTPIPNVPVLAHVLPAIEAPALFAQTGGNSTTEYALMGMLPKDPGTPTYGQTWRVRKTAQQSITNSASVISDTDLLFYGQAGRTYLFEILTIVTKTGTEVISDFQLGWTMPTGATWSGGGPGPISTIAGIGNSTSQETTGAGANWRAFSNAVGSLPYGVEANVTDGSESGAVSIMFHGSLKMGATSGVCNVVWAQRAAGGGGITTRVKEGSYLKVDMTSEYTL
jgi:hypothetical protein